MGRWFVNFASTTSLVLFFALLVVWGEDDKNRAAVGFCAAGCALLPAWRFIQIRRQDAEELRRIDYGLCRGCGYDLRQSSGRCPECGRPFLPHEKVRIKRTGREDLDRSGT